ncbi:MAG TPA: hypothetical protein VNL98_06335, partial [Gemmatimonadales bacterium]|nr:hypothetical protein [Gemmatimonadales bacterium]
MRRLPRRSLLMMALLAAWCAGARAQDRPRGAMARELAGLLEAAADSGVWGALVVSLTSGDTLLSLRADR